MFFSKIQIGTYRKSHSSRSLVYGMHSLTQPNGNCCVKQGKWLNRVWQRMFFSKMKKYFLTKKPSPLTHVVIHLSRLNSGLKFCKNKIITNSQSSGCPWKFCIIFEQEQMQAVTGLQINSCCYPSNCGSSLKLSLLFVYVNVHWFFVWGYLYNPQKIILKTNLICRCKVYVNGRSFDVFLLLLNTIY